MADERIFALSASGFVGGSQGSNRRRVPAKVTSTCEGCGTEQQFLVPSRMTNFEFGFCIGFSSKCWKCELHNKFFLLYPLDPPAAGPIEPESSFHVASRNIAIAEREVRRFEDKAYERFNSGDYDGSISLAYTVVEKYLKTLLTWRDIKFSSTEGDIRKLFKALAKDLAIDPKSIDGMAEKQFGSSCIALIGGLYELANKASDRHDALFPAARETAELALKTSFAFCEFLEFLAKQEQFADKQL